MKYTEDGSNNNLDHTVAYVYDEKNQVTQRKSTSLGSTWTMAYVYDDDGRITTATQSNVSRSFTYDTKNRLTGTTLVRDSATALTTSYAYKANTAMLSTVSLTNKAGATGKWQYSYDDNGNISQITTTVGTTAKTTQYFYDTAGQLVRENNQKAGTTTLWTYDRAGNILTEKVYAYTTGTPSTLQKTNTYTYTSTQWGDLLTAYNGNMIYYDGMTTLGSFKVGNPTTYNNGTAWTFTWEHGRQLATMTSGGTTWTNTYNSDGLRTSRTDGTTTYTYIYENGKLSAIKRNDLNMWIIYDENGPVTLKYGAGTFHYVTNPQGDVVAIVGNQGQKLVEYTYDAWGKVTSITGDYAYNLGVHNPILYRGYLYDHETGFYYCQSRYYDPEIGRFLNADTLVSTGQGILGNNMFAYCRNNPVCRVDTRGTEDAVAYNDGELLSSDDLEERAKGAGSTGDSSHPMPQDGSTMTTSEALTAAEAFLGQGYVQAAPGRFTSSDGMYQVRFLNTDLAMHDNHAGAPHLNFEIWKENQYRPGRMIRIENSHVFIVE